MKQPITISRCVYYYIKDKVVYKISLCDDGDTCARYGVSSVTDTNKECAIPFIKVRKNEATEDEIYYLDCYIEDGDKYNNKFTKHSDETTEGGESVDGDDIPTYFENLCKAEIKDAVGKRPKADFQYFNDNKDLLGVPPYMIANNGYTVTGCNQISFTETDFKKYQKEYFNERVQKEADTLAELYDYDKIDLTDCLS
jgi:hypothetical protein